MSPEVESAMFKLREYMFESVYTNPKAKSQEEQAIRLVKHLYEYYMENLDQLPNEYHIVIEKLNEPPYQVVCDYIAGMTDRFAVAKYKELMIPSAWSVY
jgi:dGTPase